MGKDRLSETETCLNQTETHEPKCWRTAVSVVKGFFSTSHKPEVCNSVERASLDLKVVRFWGKQLHFDIFPVFCGSKSNSYPRSNGCLVSKTTFLSVWQIWHSAMKVDADFKHYKGKLQTGKSVSLIWCQVCEFERVRLCVWIQYLYLCMCIKNVCVCVCVTYHICYSVQICNLEWPFIYKSWGRCGCLTSNDGLDTKP